MNVIYSLAVGFLAGLVVTVSAYSIVPAIVQERSHGLMVTPALTKDIAELQASIQALRRTLTQVRAEAVDHADLAAIQAAVRDVIRMETKQSRTLLSQEKREAITDAQQRQYQSLRDRLLASSSAGQGVSLGALVRDSKFNALPTTLQNQLMADIMRALNSGQLDQAQWLDGE